jgi:hypothetical protein
MLMLVYGYFVWAKFDFFFSCFFLTVTAPTLLLVFVPTRYLFPFRGEVEK